MNSLNTTAAKTDVSPRQHASLSKSIVARVLASGMALSSALSGCASDEDSVVIGFSAVGFDGADGNINLPEDATSTDAAGDVTTTTDSGAAGMAGDASATTDAVDAVDAATVNETSDAGTSQTGADSTMSETVDTFTPADVPTSGGQDTTIANSVVDAGTVNTTDATSKPDTQSSETTPSSPKQICDEKKAAIIATLKPGAPECTGTIPGVGKVAGELVCDGTNLEPNCIIK